MTGDGPCDSPCNPSVGVVQGMSMSGPDNVPQRDRRSIAFVVDNRRRAVAFQAAVLSQCFAQHEFDLRIDATQIVIGPVLHRFQHGSTDA